MFWVCVLFALAVTGALPDTDGPNTVSVATQVSPDPAVANSDPAWGGFLNCDASAGRTTAAIGDVVQLLVTSVQTSPDPLAGTGNFTVTYDPTQFAFVTDSVDGGACDTSVPGVVTCPQTALDDATSPSGRSDGFFFTVLGFGNNLTVQETVVINDASGTHLISASRLFYLCVPVNVTVAYLSTFNFTVLGGSAVTNTGNTVVTGNLGVYPTAAVSGFPPGVVVDGNIHIADGEAAAAQVVVATTYTAVGMQTCTLDLSGIDLGGLVLTPGVYCFSTTAELTGTLMLNGTGNCSAVFIFKIGSALITAASSVVLAIDGAQALNTFWQVGTSATIGASSTFLGTILANTAITVENGAIVEGRLLAQTADVTLDDDAVTAPTPSAFCSTNCTPNPVTCLQGFCNVTYLADVYGPADFNITCPEFSEEILFFGNMCNVTCRNNTLVGSTFTCEGNNSWVGPPVECPDPPPPPPPPSSPPPPPPSPSPPPPPPPARRRGPCCLCCKR